MNFCKTLFALTTCDKKKIEKGGQQDWCLLTEERFDAIRNIDRYHRFERFHPDKLVDIQ